ncbi:MAG: hypothetical protein JSU63_05570 [Phycisphaerales bacterium]|nr:MAG: hypothetical protein JSU63_05570 [Phycisphaerales bacterium]
MKAKDDYREGQRRKRTGVCAAVVMLSGLMNTVYARPPVDPLPPPFFSFGLESPSIVLGHVPADAILQVDSPYPTVVVPGEDLGLGREGDDLDALSLANDMFVSSETFAMLFSIDVDSVGVAAPDVDLVTAGLPYNALDQAFRHQSAGDQFMSTVLFLQGGGKRATRRLSLNNVLVRNNFDEGGVDFSAQPPSSANDAIFDAAQDRVDATITTEVLTAVYFSASATSPSLEFLPGSSDPSGAHVFLATANPWQTVLFASFSNLGLAQDDDIDALLVFDTGIVGTFDDSDVILFSLAADSPSLGTIPGASFSGGAADVFSVTVGGSPQVFVSAADLGLGHSEDNLDALDYVLCSNVTACAIAHGIRGTLDIPAASLWGLIVLTLLQFVGATIIILRHRPA